MEAMPVGTTTPELLEAGTQQFKNSAAQQHQQNVEGGGARGARGAPQHSTSLVIFIAVKCLIARSEGWARRAPERAGGTAGVGRRPLETGFHCKPPVTFHKVRILRGHCQGTAWRKRGIIFAL